MVLVLWASHKKVEIGFINEGSVGGRISGVLMLTACDLVAGAPCLAAGGRLRSGNQCRGQGEAHARPLARFCPSDSYQIFRFTNSCESQDGDGSGHYLPCPFLAHLVCLPEIQVGLGLVPYLQSPVTCCPASSCLCSRGDSAWPPGYTWLLPHQRSPPRLLDTSLNTSMIILVLNLELEAFVVQRVAGSCVKWAVGVHTYGLLSRWYPLDLWG